MYEAKELSSVSGRAHEIDVGDESEPRRSAARSIGEPSIVVARAQGTVVVTVQGEFDAERSQFLGGILADLIDGQATCQSSWTSAAPDPDCLWTLTEAAECTRR